MTASENSVFIAYDLRDSDEAEALTAALEQQGLGVWLGWRDKAPAGSAGDYAEQLRGSAAACGALVLLLTGSAGDLAERRDLIQRAYKAGKPIFVVRADEAAAVPDFPALLGVAGTEAFGPSRDANLAALAQAIAAATGSAAANAAPATEARVNPSSAGLYAEPPAAPPAAPVYAAAPPPAYAPPPPPVYAAPPAPPAPPAYAPPPSAPAYAAPAAPAYASPAPPAYAAAPALPDDERAHLMRAFVGPNADFYLRKWEEMRVRNSTTSWNWAAFLCSVFWLAYRRMFGHALLTAGALLAFQIIGPMINGLVYIFNGLSIGIAVAIGINGNRLYRQHAERALAETQAAVPDPAARQTVLAARGGVSMPAALGTLAIWVALLLGLSYVVWLAQHDGRSRSTYSGSSSYGGLGGSADESWLVGQWTAVTGVSGPYCSTWIRYNANHTLGDNAFGTGTWSLSGSGGSYTLTMTSSSGTHSGIITRSGDTMTMGAGGNTITWRRATC